MSDPKTEMYSVPRYDDFPKFGVHERQAFTIKARFAEQILNRWGLYIFDSTAPEGKKLCEPAEVVARAMETTELFFAEAEKRGWIIEFPSLADIPKLPPVPKNPD
jgi:hypothetical protein